MCRPAALWRAAVGVPLRRNDSCASTVIIEVANGGEDIIQELLNKQMILLPMAIDPHGRWGPITNTFLNGNDHRTNYTFQQNRQHAAAMLRRATSSPSPIGILRTANANWNRNKLRTFYGHSYTAPTPSIYTIHQLGLGITKAYSVHIRNATKHIGWTTDSVGTHFPITNSVDQ